MDQARPSSGPLALAPPIDDADGWLAQADALRRNANVDAALACCLRAVRLAPQSAAVWSNLGILWLMLGHFEQALRCHRNAIALDRRQPELCLEYARALRAIGDLAQAEAVLDACLEVEPERAELLFERACIRLLCGRHAQAWPDFEARLRLRPGSLPDLPLPRWRGEPIEGRRLLLLAEPGLPDALWAMRFITLLARRGATITLRCPSALHPVLAELPVRLLDSLDDIAVSEHDLQCALLSLSGLVEPRGCLVPEPAPVSVPAESCAWFAQRSVGAEAALRVGIAWSEDAAGADRDAQLQRLLPALAALPGVRLFLLQQGGALDGFPVGCAECPIIDAVAQSRHFGDTAAVLDRMDVVVANDGAVARLAGAMEKPALILLPYSAHWIYGRDADATPWYPTLRLLRQPEPGEWRPVIDELQRLLMCWAYARVQRAYA